MSFNITVSKKFSKIISSQHRGERLFLTTLRYLKLINKSIKPIYLKNNYKYCIIQELRIFNFKQVWSNNENNSIKNNYEQT